jgi:flagellar motor switch protein FliN
LTEAIEYEQFEQGAQAGTASLSEPDLSRVSDIPMELSVEIGRTHMTVGETLQLTVGSVVTLEREAGQAVDLLVNGTAIARGEVVVVDEQYGLRVTEILDGQDSDLKGSADAGAPAEDSLESDAPTAGTPAEG